MQEIRIELVPIASLQAARYNPRRMPEEQMLRLMRGIEEFGVVDPVIVNRTTGNIVGGHQRVEACRRLERESIPVVYLDLDAVRERALNLALNKIHGEWDEERLRALLSEIAATDIDLELTGFSGDELDSLIGNVADVIEPLCDPDEVPPIPVAPITKPGDLIILGRHRLLCGDSTKAENLERMVDGKPVRMVFTDPPYNVAYEGKTKDALTIQNDSMGDADFYEFLLAAYRAMLAVTAPGGAIYVCHSDTEGANFRRALVEAGWLFKQCIIWVKQAFVMGRQDYQWQHESILYGWAPGQESCANCGYVCYFQEHEPILYGWAPGAAHQWHGGRKQSTVWEFNKPNRNGEHPTMKPVELVARALENSSSPGEVVLDPFGGSGTTLIAAEMTGRKACLCELDPKYCDVIVDRWERFSGKKAARPS